MADDKKGKGSEKTKDKSDASAPQGAETGGSSTEAPLQTGGTNDTAGTQAPSGNGAAGEGSGEAASADAAKSGDSTPLITPEKQLAPKRIMGRIRDLVKQIPPGGELDLYTLIGQANNLRTGESNFGAWTALVGNFEAVNLLTGETFIGPESHIPGPAGDLLCNQVRKFIIRPIEQTENEKKNRTQRYEATGEYVEFALYVSLRENMREGGQPYQFVTRPITDLRKADVLASLRTSMADKVAARFPQLAARMRSAAPALPAPPAAQETPKS